MIWNKDKTYRLRALMPEYELYVEFYFEETPKPFSQWRVPIAHSPYPCWTYYEFIFYGVEEVDRFIADCEAWHDQRNA